MSTSYYGLLRQPISHDVMADQTDRGPAAGSERETKRRKSPPRQRELVVLRGKGCDLDPVSTSAAFPLHSISPTRQSLHKSHGTGRGSVEVDENVTARLVDGRDFGACNEPHLPVPL
jgi:hypothetical protein